MFRNHVSLKAFSLRYAASFRDHTFIFSFALSHQQCYENAESRISELRSPHVGGVVTALQAKDDGPVLVFNLQLTLCPEPFTLHSMTNMTLGPEHFTLHFMTNMTSFALEQSWR